MKKIIATPALARKHAKLRLELALLNFKKTCGWFSAEDEKRRQEILIKLNIRY